MGFADTGEGMTPQQTEKIFEPFQSDFKGGTGLGLAIVYQIMQAHEGKVWARSRPGHGYHIRAQSAPLRCGAAANRRKPSFGADGCRVAAGGSHG